MKKILAIQFRTDISRDHEQECIFNTAKNDGGVAIDIINIFDSAVAWSNPEQVLSGYEGLILGGSGEFYLSEEEGRERPNKVGELVENIKPVINHILERDFPTLAICFGHQLIGEILGNRVVRDARYQKTGSFSVRRRKEACDDPIFTDVPEEFMAQYAHKDSLVELPTGAIPLACGDRCAVSGYKYKQNIYSFQFHPEMDDTAMAHRMNMYLEYVDGDHAEFKKALRPSPASSQIFLNFITHIVQPIQSAREQKSIVSMQA